MKAKTLVGGAVILTLLFLPVLAVNAQQYQHEHGVPPAPAEAQESATGPMCNPEHMRMMLQNTQDKECVVDGVLKDQQATEILMDKIVGDPALRRQMMDKMHSEMQKRMMEHRGTQGPGGQPPAKGGAMQGGEGGATQSEGGMMEGHGGMMQQESK